MPEGSVKPDTMRFRELIDDIDKGVLKIPEFQRKFDWDLERTLRLLDSIAKRYPIGAFLLWDTDEVFGSLRNIGEIDLPQVAEGKDVCYVLDGQQRITSLYAAAKGATIGKQCYEVFCDLDADPLRDEVFTSERTSPRSQVSLETLLSDHAHEITPKLAPKRRVRFGEVRDAFREYLFPVVRVRNQPLEAVCKMFERVNTGGMELTVFDIMVAKTWTPSFNLREKWENLRLEFDRRGYGALKPIAVLQSAAACLHGGVRQGHIMDIGRDELGPGWGHVTACMRLAIDFLRQALAVPGTHFLSYPAVVPVLAYFFHENGRSAPSKAQRERLEEYFWRCGFTERYGSNPSSTIAEDLARVKRIVSLADETVPVAEPVYPEYVAGTRLRTGSAYCRALLAVMGYQRPVDLQSGTEIILDNSNLSRSNSRHYHHIFPKKWLARNQYADNVNSIANIMLVPEKTNLQIGAKPPVEYMDAYARAAGGQWEKWLRTHFITKRAATAMMEGDFEAFLRHRGSAIARAANRHMGLSAADVKRMQKEKEWEDEED